METKYQVCVGRTSLTFDEASLSFTIQADETVWSWAKEYRPYILMQDGTEIPFSSASSIRHGVFENGIGKGICSSYEGFAVNGTQVEFAFDTMAWIEFSTGDIRFELIPMKEAGLEFKAIYWPGYMEFDTGDDRWYSVLNVLQGLLLPNTWENEVTKLGFDGYGSIPTRKYPKGVPNQMLMRSIESGTSFRKKNAVVRKSVNGARKKAVKTMGETIDEELRKEI